MTALLFAPHHRRHDGVSITRARAGRQYLGRRINAFNIGSMLRARVDAMERRYYGFRSRWHAVPQRRRVINAKAEAATRRLSCYRAVVDVYL